MNSFNWTNVVWAEMIISSSILTKTKGEINPIQGAQIKHLSAVMTETELHHNTLFFPLVPTGISDCDSKSKQDFWLSGCRRVFTLAEHLHWGCSTISIDLRRTPRPWNKTKTKKISKLNSNKSPKECASNLSPHASFESPQSSLLQKR